MADSEGLVHVPTMAEQLKAGKARSVIIESIGKNGKVTKNEAYQFTPEGQREVDEAMIHNGKYLHEHPEVSNELFTGSIERLRKGVE